MSTLIFVSGGARSGKSTFAQHQAEQRPGQLLYVATAAIGDDEMALRVARHRAARGPRWDVLEEPLDLCGRLPTAAAGKGGVVLDCITLWLTNLYFSREEQGEAVLDEIDRFLALTPALDAPLWLVSNELGSGIVPENRLARDFRDLAGEVNQRLAAASHEAWLVVAGLPLRLK